MPRQVLDCIAINNPKLLCIQHEDFEDRLEIVAKRMNRSELFRKVKLQTDWWYRPRDMDYDSASCCEDDDVEKDVLE
jgi:hypothetical protein